MCLSFIVFYHRLFTYFEAIFNYILQINKIYKRFSIYVTEIVIENCYISQVIVMTTQTPQCVLIKKTKTKGQDA